LLVNRRASLSASASRPCFIEHAAPTSERNRPRRRRRPLALSDEQLRSVMDIAGQFAPSMRGTFLEALATRLRGIAEHGDGIVHRHATMLARELLIAPGSGPGAGSGGEPDDAP
jgi:hypothetical protein